LRVFVSAIANLRNLLDITKRQKRSGLPVRQIGDHAFIQSAVIADQGFKRFDFHDFLVKRGAEAPHQRLRSYGRIDIAGHESFWTVNRQRETLFDTDREHVVLEVLVVLARQKHFDAHSVEDLRTEVERTGQELARRNCLGLDDRQIPQRRTDRGLGIANDVIAAKILGQLDPGPVRRVQNEAARRILG